MITTTALSAAMTAFRMALTESRSSIALPPLAEFWLEYGTRHCVGPPTLQRSQSPRLPDSYPVSQPRPDRLLKRGARILSNRLRPRPAWREARCHGRQRRAWERLASPPQAAAWPLPPAAA